MSTLEEYYSKYKQSVFNMCYLYLQNRHSAEDQVQIVFLKYIEKSPRFKDDNHAKAWFLRCAKNACIDEMRKARHTREDSREDMDAYTDDPKPEMPAIAMLATLPEKYRNVLYLTVVDGYSEKDAAKILRRPESTVRTQLQRAKKMLREKLESGKEETI